jgi:AraC family transcriptional regulator
MNHAPADFAPKLGRHESFGDCVRRIGLAGTVIRDTRLPASVELPRHQHTAAYLCIVLAGSYAEHARREIVCGPGSIVNHPSGHVHANRTGPAGARCVNVELDESLLAEGPLAELAGSERQIQMIASHRALARLRDALALADSTAGLAAYAAVLDVVCAGIQAPTATGRARWLQQVVDYLEADLAYTPTLDELAQLARVHANHLIRTFKQMHGESVGAYLRRRRLETADRELCCGDRSLASIAAVAGFCDQAHFTRAYGRHFGITPGQRRKRFAS